MGLLIIKFFNMLPYDIVEYRGIKASIAKSSEAYKNSLFIEFLDENNKHDKPHKLGWVMGAYRSYFDKDHISIGIGKYWSVSKEDLILIESRNDVPYNRNASAEHLIFN
jgi:hypothetical protein